MSRVNVPINTLFSAKTAVLAVICTSRSTDNQTNQKTKHGEKQSNQTQSKWP